MNDTSKPEAAKRIGQGMWMLFWCLLLAGLVFYFADVEEALYNPNAQLQSAQVDGRKEIILNANRFGHYILPGSINGHPVNLLIDTGASAVVVPADKARRLGLKTGPRMRVNTANGTIEVFRTRIDSLSLGPIVLHDIPASINPHMEGEILLGMSALGSLELNQKDGQLRIIQ